MRLIRFFYRLFGLSLVTVFDYLLLHFGNLILFFAGEQRIKWRKLVVHIWARTVARILGLQINVKGRPPQPPFYLVSNHLSYVDIIVYFTQVHCIFVAKAELAHWPVFGWLAKSGNTLFIDRSNKKDIPRVNALIEKAMHESDGIIIFPEGTSTKGSEVLPFKSPLLEYAAEKNFPVSYATIHYRTSPSDPPAHLSVCWWGDMTFGGHFLDLLKVSRICATVEFGPTTVSGSDRKIIAQELWQQINKQFVPTVNIK
ncbi:MAG: 1-acyl-sn-glycerol-3-phosphate acyltransferase [candidate division KSB1 bacterium]|nr:1-acyl-sn-glycerol-3-phosphate acyltransferase [candidate division KSB1 bacterium]MDZ7304353.1 1-acyl-sn-glycerol-3-phosphate acyltransferase [candidate division KSB1 bacterium]MDZ7313666.1 1-acyl-sn-glycerol-3-phosphate acyltransferase [candidate division KSB1 bacterium]